MMKNSIEVVLENEDINNETIGDYERLESNSLFEVYKLASLKYNDCENRTFSNSFIWNNYSKNFVAAFGNNISNLQIGEKVSVIFNNKLPFDSLKAVSNLPLSHIIVGVSSNNKIIFYDGKRNNCAELPLIIPLLNRPVIYCHRWKNQTYVIVNDKDAETTVWITLSGQISFYERADNLSEAINKKTTSGIIDDPLSNGVITFNPEKNLLYYFTGNSEGFNKCYRLTSEGMFLYKEAYSTKGYLSVTVTPSFGFALSIDGYLDIFELKMFVVCKKLSLLTSNTNNYEIIHDMQVLATSTTCSLEGLYIILSISIENKHQLQIKMISTNEIVYSFDCNKNSTFIRWYPILNAIVFVEPLDRQLNLKMITEAIPDIKVEKLISMKKFDEAMNLAKKFGVSLDLIYKAKASDLIEKLKSDDYDNEDVDNFYRILNKIMNQDVVCDLCLEGIISLKMFNIVKKLLDIGLDTRTKNCYILEQFNVVSEQFTTANMIFSSSEFFEKWLSIVTQQTSMYSLMADSIEEGNYKRADIIWNRNILKSEFNKNITKENAEKMVKIFSYHVLYEDIRNNLMKFMEKSFMPYTLMSLGSEMGCMYAETLIKIIFDLEDEENENFPSVAYEISLSLERIFKTVKERALTPGEKCFFVDIITSMGYDSFSSTDIFGRLNELKENLLKLVFLNERYNLTFKFEQFINLSKEDIGIHIIEKMFIQENDYEYIYRNIFKPYCEEFVLDFKLLICDFVQKWSTQQLSFTQDFQRGNLKDKIDRICNIIENIDDSMLQIKTLQHLVDAVSFEWPKKLTQSVYTLLTDTSISKDIKNNLADCCKLSNIRQIVKNYKDLSYDIKEIIKNRNEFEYFIQSLSVSSSSINVEILAKDIMKLCQLRHSYCKLSESFNITYDYIYEQLWIPHLIQWRYSEFEKKEPTQWLFNLPNNEAKVAVAKYSVEYLLKIYECGQEKLKSSEEIICYFKTLSVIKSFILNYLFKIKKYKLIFDKVVSIESLYSCFKILVPQTFFLETPKETANFINVLISNYNIEDWENMLKVIKITNMDNVLAYQYLLNACLENGKIGQVSEILFTLSFDRCLLTSKMISMIKVVLDKTFLKLYEAWSEKSFDIIQFSNIVLLALKVFMIEGNGSDKTNFYDIIAFSTYHKFLNTVINIVNSKDVYTLQDDTVEFMNTSDYINWELHSLSHLQKECKLDYYMAFNPKSKLFTRSCLQLPMNGEYNIETLLYIAASLVEYEKLDQIKFRDYIDGWKNLFNQLLIDGQFFDVFNLLEIYNTLVISKKENIYVDEIIKHSAVGLLERILLIPDCDLELATGLISTISERYIPSILQEIRNRLKTNTNPRVYINLCELVSMIYHKIPQIGIIEMLEKKYDESLWKRKFSKFGFNYSNIMTFNEIVSSLVRFNVPNNIAHEYCIYNNINFNLFCLQFALESCLYTSELLEMNDHIKYIEQLKKTSTLISGIIINEDHIILIQETIMKMSPYNHEGLLLLIDKLLQFTKVKNISDDLKYLFYNWKNVIDFLISYGKRSAEILSIECNWLSSLKLSLGNEVLSTTSFDSIESIQLVGEMSIIEFQVMEEERESARKRMPQCAIQRLPFHLLCCTSENEMKELVYPVVSNEINIHNIFKWINIIVNTKSILCFSQSECIITAIKKRIKYVEENNIFVGDFDRNLIISIINFIDVSNITTVVKYSLLYIGNLRNLIIKIAYLNIFKEVIKTNIKLLEDDKQEEFLKYEKELSKKIIKYSIEKILSDNGLFNQESKEFFYNGNINEMICFIYNNSIDWNNYQDRISKMKACKMITEVIGYDISSIHTTIIDKLLIQNTITQINDPDATINISDEVLSINQEVSNRFECDIWYDDVNVSQIVYILSAGNYNNMIKKMFSILNKDPKILPGGIITYIRVLICICRMYPRDGKKYECFKAKKSQVLTVLKGSYYYHMLSSINVNCKITDLINDKKMLEILKQLQNCPVHSMERDFVILNIIRDYLKKSPEYPTYMKTYIPRMIMGRQFFMVNCILSDTYSPITSDHMGSNILQFVLKTIEGILKQNVNNNDIIEDMLRFLMKHSISFGYSRPPRETGLFSSGNDMSKIAHYILNPTGN